MELASLHWPEGVCIALDNEQAFNALSWKYMFAVLEHLGLVSQMRCGIKILYAGPTERHRTGRYILGC